jgi:predicted dienelactone hydrolase
LPHHASRGPPLAATALFCQGAPASRLGKEGSPPLKTLTRSWAAVLIGLLGCGDSTPATSVDTFATDTSATDTSTPDLSEADTSTPDLSEADTSAPSSLLDFDLSEPGPFAVGFRTLEHTYTPPGTSTPRQILLNIWYPTTTTTGPHPSYMGFFEDPDVVLDAPLAPPVEALGYPVHIYSHGHTGFGGTSSFLMRHFASHGWVAVAPDHTGNTMMDNINPRPFSIYYLRSTDITATLDVLENLPAADPLASHLRTDRVVMSGHSFGVHTCWATAGATFDMPLLNAGCAEGGEFSPCTEDELAVFEAGLRDPRVVATVPMAGSINRKLFGPSGHTSAQIPILAISGTADPVGAEGQYDSTTGLDLTWLDLAGGCHQTFALGLCDTLDPALGFRIIDTYALAFARRHVLGDDSPSTLSILDGTTPVSATVTFHGPRR